MTTNTQPRTVRGFTSYNPCASGQTGCDLFGNNVALAKDQSSFTTANGGTDPPAGFYGFSELTTADFTRPSETRCTGDWVKTFADATANAGGVPMHPIGVSIGYMDGHAKFIVSEGNTYYSGCDGIDYAWDFAGSCNIKGLQRDAD